MEYINSLSYTHFFKVKAFHYTIFKNHTIKLPSITRDFKCLEHKATGKYFPKFQFSLESLNVIIGGKVRFFSLEGQVYRSFLNFVEMTAKCPGIPISLFFFFQVKIVFNEKFANLDGNSITKNALPQYKHCISLYSKKTMCPSYSLTQILKTCNATLRFNNLTFFTATAKI